MLPFTHLAPIADKIPEANHLLGRDILSTWAAKSAPNDTICVAARRVLGCHTVGLSRFVWEEPTSLLNACKVHVLQNGQTSVVSPCTSNIQMNEKLSAQVKSPVYCSLLETQKISYKQPRWNCVSENHWWWQGFKSFLNLKHILEQKTVMRDHSIHFIQKIIFRLNQSLLWDRC